MTLAAALALGAVIFGQSLASARRADAGPAPSGVASQSAAHIVATARSAIEGVSSVHLSGSGVSGRTRFGVDLEIVTGKGGSGTITENGGALQIVVIGQTGYFNGDAAFWTQTSGPAAAKLFSGRWLKAPTNGQFAALASLTNTHAAFDALLSPDGPVVKGAVTKVRGQRVVAVTNRASGGTLYVATTGKPYPVEVVNAREHGTIVIDRINKPFRLVAPAKAIDVAALEQSAQAAADASAKELAHSAEVAAETYATDHNGSYVGLTPRVLHSFEATIQIAPGNGNAYVSYATGTPIGYVITVIPGSGGETFTITRAGGGIVRTCTPASGVNGGCHNGTW